MYTKGLGGRRSLLVRIRFQLLGGLIFAIALPALVRAAMGPAALASTNMQVTLVAASIAHVVGFYCWRRIGLFPGMAGASTILPAFAFSYGAIFIAIFFFRLDYSRFQAGASFAMSVLWYFGLAVIASRVERYRLGIVPVGDVDRLRNIPGVDWHTIPTSETAITTLRAVVADLRADIPPEWERFIADCALSGVPVYHVKQMSESLTGRVEIEHLSENTLGSLTPNHAYLKMKEGLDWIFALAGLIVFTPLGFLIAAAIKLDSPGPALFRQVRMGYRGIPFTVYKFRTMTAAPEQEPSAAIDAAVTQTKDNRVTRLGRILRQSRLDEVPQLINVLRGEMSWIGPRPEALVLSRWYEQELPFYRYRHIVRPGISGWAQVNQGHVSDVDEVLEKLHYDFYYIKNFSPWLDLIIALRTIRTMVTGFGAK